MRPCGGYSWCSSLRASRAARSWSAWLLAASLPGHDHTPQRTGHDHLTALKYSLAIGMDSNDATYEYLVAVGLAYGPGIEDRPHLFT